MCRSTSVDMPDRLPDPILDRLPDAVWHKDCVGMSGMDIFRVETPDARFYLKIDKTGSDALWTEAAQLRWLRGKLPAPDVLFEGRRNGSVATYLLMSAIPGQSMVETPYRTDPDAVADVLAQGLRLLADVPVADCPFDARLDVRLAEARDLVEAGRVRQEDWEASTRFKSPEALLRYLEDNRPEETHPVFTHGDYCLPNVLAIDCRLSGLVDWGRAGMADPWQDIALAARSLEHNFGIRGTDAFSRLLERLGRTPDPERMEYYVLMDELF